MKVEQIKDRNRRAIVSDRIVRLREYRDELAAETDKHETRMALLAERKTEILRDLSLDICEPGVNLDELEARIDVDKEDIKDLRKELIE